ncbi:hypothetical protein V6R21_18905 [Limibacter armeniacum]|uniref:hypothetical protein n=1 Tax=Limibacter armeniacum TaxID=466084 RepID=UPI002FE501B5
MPENQEEKINERIKKILVMSGLSKSDFARSIGVTPQTLNNVIGPKQSSPNATILANIITTYSSINHIWLLTGSGSIHTEEEESDKAVKIRGKGNIVADNNTGVLGNNIKTSSRSEESIKLELLLEKEKVRSLSEKVNSLSEQLKTKDEQIKTKDEMIELLKSMLQK